MIPLKASGAEFARPFCSAAAIVQHVAFHLRQMALRPFPFCSAMDIQSIAGMGILFTAVHADVGSSSKCIGLM